MSLPTPHFIRRFASVLALSLLLRIGTAAFAQPNSREISPTARPFLRIETGFHAGAIRGLSADRSGRLLATGAGDKTARLWDVMTGRELRVFRPPLGEGVEGQIDSVALSPDGALLAAGGQTGLAFGAAYRVYLFDAKTGEMRANLGPLPGNICALKFSRDGQFLAAGLSNKGVRVYRARDFLLLGTDENYAGGVYGLAFSGAGTLATSSLDGQIRLYDKTFQLAQKRALTRRALPFSLAFSPDDSQIAVGYADAPALDVVAAKDLNLVFSPDATLAQTAGETSKNAGLGAVAWSSDGEFLYGAGTVDRAGDNPIFRWSRGGRGEAEPLAAAKNAILALETLPGGALAYAAGDPALGIFDARAQKRELRVGDTADFRSGDLLTNENATAWGFSFASQNAAPAFFSLDERAVDLDPAAREEYRALQKPRQSAPGLELTDWKDGFSPRCNGVELPLERNERARCVAVAPGGSGFALGTNWALRFYNANGQPKWRAQAPGTVWGVNISGDGKTVLAACSDGTIRFYRAEDGLEKLAFFPAKDGARWILWTPGGFYDCSPGGDLLIGWHLNRGGNRSGDFFEAARFHEARYRPGLILHALQLGEEKAAFAALEAQEKNAKLLAQKQEAERLALLERERTTGENRLRELQTAWEKERTLAQNREVSLRELQGRFDALALQKAKVDGALGAQLRAARVLQTELENLKKARAANTQDLDGNAAKLREANLQIALLQTQLQSKNDELRAQKTLAEGLGTQIAALQKQREAGALEAQIAKTQIAQLQSDLALLKNGGHKDAQILQTQTEQYRASQTEIAGLKEQLAASLKKQSELETGLANSKAQITQLTAQIAQSKTQATTQRAQIADLNAQIEKTKAQKTAQNTTDQNAALARLTAQLSGAQSDLAAANKLLETQKSQLQTQNAELEKRKTELATFSVDNGKKDEQIRLLNAKIETQNATLKALQAQIAGGTDRQNLIQSQTAQIAVKTAEVEKLEADLKTRDALAADLKTRLEAQTAKFARLQTESDEKTAQLATLQKSFDDAGAQIARLQKADLESQAKIKAQTALLTKQQSEFDAKIQNLAKNDTQLKTALDNLTKAQSDLQLKQIVIEQTRSQLALAQTELAKTREKNLLLETQLAQQKTDLQKQNVEIATFRAKQEADILKLVPPVLSIVGPSAQNGELSFDSTRVTLKYRVRVPSGEPVEEIKAFVNGVPLPLSRDFLKTATAKPDDEWTREISVEVPPRDCEVALVASNRFSQCAPQTLRLRWKGAPQPVPARNLYVLAVGVSKYNEVDLNLRLAAKDATDLSTMLTRQKGLFYQNVVVKTLTDESATKNNIIDALDWIAQAPQNPEDLAIIFLSGHGYTRALGDVGTFYFCPTDVSSSNISTTGLNYSEIKDRIPSVKSRLILMVDACHSGDVVTSSVRGKDGKERVDLRPLTVNMANSQGGALVMTASTGQQLSYEGTGGIQNGNFTHAMLEGLSKSTELTCADGEISCDALSLYVSRTVKKLSGGKQTPTLAKPPNLPDFGLARCLN